MTQNNMPELPEVETVKNTLKELVLNKTINRVEVLRAKNIDGDEKEFINILEGSTIIDFSRVGKFIIFHFDKPYVLISHLRMEGKYFLKNENDKITKHDLVAFHFSDNTYLAYNDTRRFGVLKVAKKDNYLNEPPLSNVGPDPFMMKDASRLYEAFKNKNIAIKTSLLDQSIMSGLGNIYVDEVLYMCKIHPETPAKLINKKQLESILKESKIILAKAIEQGGSTIKSYHPKEGVSGNFQVSLNVYGKKDGTCPRCGHSLRKIFVNGRGTTYCPKCQKNPALVKVIGVTGPVGSGKSSAAKEIANYGYKYISADDIVHELYLDKNVQNEIKKFIPELKINNGEIDRTFLRNYLLDNPNKKRRLEKYIHSLVSDRIISLIKSTKINIVMEVPLLFESHLDDFCDEIVYVDVNKKKQNEHLLKRGSDISIIKINQSFNSENKKKATHIIVNNDDIASLKNKIKSIYGTKQSL